MKKSALPAILFFALIAALQAADVPARPASAGTPVAAANMHKLFVPAKIELSGVPVKFSGERLFLVETTVNGVPAKMLADTGASHTSLDLEWARKNFPDAGFRRAATDGGDDAYKVSSQEIPLMPVNRFEIGGNVFQGFFMPLADLRGLRAALPELRDVVGVLGMNTMTLAPCRISFGKRELQWLDRAALNAVPAKKRLFSTAVPGTECRLVAVFSPKDPRTSVFALIDCGAMDTSLPAAFWCGELPQKRRALVTTHAGVRSEEIAFGVPAPLKFSNDFSLPNVSPKLLAPDEPQKILLGSDVLSRIDLIFDRETESVFAVVPAENNAQ